VISPAQPGVTRQPIEIPPILLDVFTMVSLRTGKAEHPFFQDRIDAIPQRQGQTQIMVNVRQARHAVFVPSVCPRSGVIMGKETPGVAAVAVVLPYRAPGTLGEVGTPLVPGIRLEQIVLSPASGLSEPGVLGGGARRWRSRGHDLSRKRNGTDPESPS
jgi:hypothetical protein